MSGCEPGGIPGGMDLRPGKSGDDTGSKVRPEAREGIPKIMRIFETRDEFIQEFVGRHIQWIVAKKNTCVVEIIPVLTLDTLQHHQRTVQLSCPPGRPVTRDAFPI